MALFWAEDVSEQALAFVKEAIADREPGNNGQKVLIEDLIIETYCFVLLQAEFPVIDTNTDGKEFCRIRSNHPEAIEEFIQDGYDAFEYFVQAMGITTLEEPPTYNMAQDVRQDVVNNFLDAVRG